MDLPIKINDITLLAPYSSGGTSSVYIGLKSDFPKPLLVKIPKPELTNDKTVLQRFINEAEILSKLDHTSICSLFSSGTCQYGYYIATPFNPNTSLAQWIQSSCYSLQQAISVIYQICTAVCHIHAHNLVHLDLKPANIMIDNDNQIKIIDFDISKPPEKKVEITPTFKQLIGTFIYMSPEQQGNINQASFTSDIYTLGLIFYEILTHASVLDNVIIAAAPIGFQKILSKMLQPSVDKRYQDIVDVIYDISIYLESEIFIKDQKRFNKTSHKPQSSFQDTLNLQSTSFQCMISQKLFRNPNQQKTLFYLKNSNPIPFTVSSILDPKKIEYQHKKELFGALSLETITTSYNKVQSILNDTYTTLYPFYHSIHTLLIHPDTSTNAISLLYTEDILALHWDKSSSTLQSISLSKEILYTSKKSFLYCEKLFLNPNEAYILFTGIPSNKEFKMKFNCFISDLNALSNRLSLKHLSELFIAFLFSPFIHTNDTAFGITLIEKEEQ